MGEGVRRRFDIPERKLVDILIENNFGEEKEKRVTNGKMEKSDSQVSMTENVGILFGEKEKKEGKGVNVGNWKSWEP